MDFCLALTNSERSEFHLTPRLSQTQLIINPNRRACLPAPSQSIRKSVTGSNRKCFFGPKLSTHVVYYCGRSWRRAPRSETRSELPCCRRFMTSNRSICGKWHPRSPLQLPSPSPRNKSRWLLVADEGKSSIPIIGQVRTAVTRCCSYVLFRQLPCESGSVHFTN